MFAITRDEAQTRLSAFLPQAGSAYSKRRNYDYGSGAHDHVSRLSAALRRRSLCEEEVIASTLKQHSYAASEKFIQEVFWRTYWKGWLEMRPSIWQDYLQKTKAGFAQSDEMGRALSGATGIACFDSWHEELTTTNYLHNHARMWFASIWIHSLGLPWQAGAAFFMHHLLDGDPASNTLGWRWVAGLQTRGKAYGARADNIEQYTNGRFAPYGELQEDVAAIAGPENPPAMSIRQPRQAKGTKPLLIITSEDCHAESLAFTHQPVAVIGLPSAIAKAHAAAVMEADKKAVDDAVMRSATSLKIPHIDNQHVTSDKWQQDLEAVMAQVEADHLVMAYQPTGFWHDLFASCDLPISEQMRAYDSLCWPHAKKGFFPFKEKIPQFISALAS